jgi:hypothetical protein
MKLGFALECIALMLGSQAACYTDVATDGNP